MAGKARPKMTPARRERLAFLTTARDNAERAMNAHKALCIQCYKKGPVTAEYCDAGWELANKRSKARYDLANIDGPEYGRPEQIALF